jgi:hypothetical protein
MCRFLAVIPFDPRDVAELEVDAPVPFGLAVATEDMIDPLAWKIHAAYEKRGAGG